MFNLFNFLFKIFNKSVAEAKAGENIGVLLRGVKFTNVCRGMMLCAKDSMSSSNHFEGQMYLLDTSEGGRHRPLPVIQKFNLKFFSFFFMY